MQESVERTGDPTEHLDRHRRADVGDDREPARVDRGQRRERRHERRAVDERKTLLRLELERLEAFVGERVRRRPLATVVVDRPSARHDGRDVGQRDEVTARAHRPFFGDERRESAVEQLEQPLDELRTHGRMSPRQAVGAKQDDGARRIDGRRASCSLAQALDQACLQHPCLLRADLSVSRVAEPRRDAVDRLATRDVLERDVAAGIERSPDGGVGRQHDAGLAARDGGDLLE